MPSNLQMTQNQNKVEDKVMTFKNIYIKLKIG